MWQMAREKNQDREVTERASATFKLQEAAEGKTGGGAGGEAEGRGGNAPVQIAVGKALCSLSELQRAQGFSVDVSCASVTCTRVTCSSKRWQSWS
jgi:hypothetical protein